MTAQRILFPPRIAARWTNTTDTETKIVTGADGRIEEVDHLTLCHHPRPANDNFVSLPDGPSKVWRASRAGKGNGWDGKPDNDAQHWPLAKILRTERNDRLLKAAVRYRQIETEATSETLLRGTAHTGEELWRLDQRTWIRADGAIVYKGARAVANTDPIPPRHNGKTVGARWNGDAGLIAHIDAAPVYVRLRHALGPLTQPLNDAVIYGLTLEAIGRKEGIDGKVGARAAGRALVYRGLAVVTSIIEEL